MKNLLLILPLVALSLGLSSCCSMFGIKSFSAGYTEETYQRKLCGYDVVREEVVVDANEVSGDANEVVARDTMDTLGQDPE